MDENAKEESMRDQAKRISKQFKTSWVDIGEFLTKIAHEKLYQEWGYKRFEDYCKSELKLKKATAMKLTNAYFFITNEEPGLKDTDLDVVTVLQKAKKNDKCDSEIYNELIDVALKGRAASTLDNALSKLTKSGDQTSEFYRMNAGLASRLLGRIKPIQEVSEKHKESLSEMKDFFEAESKHS